ncbi:hypothetical protein CU098_013086 [Rhizopus stolonifer]|uniref:Major facilitator superfamily (MFS) profile domain-containing protein n=1 Tax=Rhizopus stolonifer TaxID=4846 RepID=A0A367KUY3_RHIST|nr:hypothetical protein CU098_013086 [Rhizopus stolonifer]
MPWGLLSDRIGRKPVVLMGFGSTSIGVLLFGLSKSFAWALATKIFSVTFGLSSIVGAALGGYLSNPVSKYPSVFGKMGYMTRFLIEYPYFLPCFFATCLSTVCWLMGFFSMKETLELKKTLEDEQLLLAEQHEEYQTFSSQKSKRKLSNILLPEILAISILYAAVSFEMLYFDELLPTWSATPKEAGGLVYLLHHLVDLFGLLHLFQKALFAGAFVFLTQGLCRLLYQVPHLSGYDTKFWVWTVLVMCLTIKTLAQTIAITTAVILLNNSVSNYNTLGFVNEFSQSMRTLNPTVAGYIWSRSIMMEWLPLGVRAYVSWLVSWVWLVSSRLLGACD